MPVYGGLPSSSMATRGTKFIVKAEYPPEKQKLYVDKLREAMKDRGLPIGEPLVTGMTGFSFTLDEALDYFTKMKQFQNAIEARERGEETSAPTA